jgi:hypothetical protein
MSRSSGLQSPKLAIAKVHTFGSEHQMCKHSDVQKIDHLSPGESESLRSWKRPNPKRRFEESEMENPAHC